MTSVEQPRSPESVSSSLAAAAEDHALVSVPAADRRNGFQLALSPVSVATALVIFAIAGFTVTLAGFVWGLVAGVAVGLFGFALGKLLGDMAYRTGLSGTVTSRFFGFGQRGSAVGSVVFAVMILGFLAVESALLYEGTLLMFEWEDTWASKIGVYGVLTLLWIALAIFGLKLALRAGAAMIVVTLLVTAYMIVQIYVVDGASMSAVFEFEGVVPGGGWTKFETAVSVMGATAGTIALVTADFARYARTGRDVTVLAAAGPLVQNVVMIVLGSLVVIGGMPEVVEYLMARDAGLSPEAAAGAGSGLVMGNTGAFFVIFAGWAGFITIYAAQAKAQAINAYSGSLTLVNLVDSLFGKKPGRAVMVVVGNLIALVMIAAGILDEFNTYLTYLGAMTLAMAGVMIADYYVVRRGNVDGSHRVERWNWAGVITLVLSAGIGIWLMEAEVLTLGFLVSFVVALVGYPLLRSAMPEGTATGYVDEADALAEAF
ncbi:cytosine permease [Nocardioides sp. cx-173]|uniref:purine-cytosine permease family protein n=1 Tax=Nocardioides sp. cx-173 TaxID=2898796 RepID=UPI001E44997E|nr:cytosine permease [Nocardioides sp. cx-173]MCD4526889.1 cytosine permease [Nocardioides sp. cx-173]UGB41322.1 cytosine permease [Nocardioides sp. cx-173]